MLEIIVHSKKIKLGLLLLLFILSCLLIKPSETNIFWRLPPLLKEIPYVINDVIKYLMFEWMLIDVYDPIIEEYEQKPLFREITRTIATSILFVINFIREIFLNKIPACKCHYGFHSTQENFSDKINYK